MSYLADRDQLKLKTTPEQDRACLFLEKHGQEFLKEFGTDNAIEKARELRRKLPRKRSKPEFQLKPRRRIIL